MSFSPEERIEFEKLCVQHEDILNARTSFEIAMEKLLLSHAVAPAVEVKEKVMDAIEQSKKFMLKGKHHLLTKLDK